MNCTQSYRILWNGMYVITHKKFSFFLAEERKKIAEDAFFFLFEKMIAQKSVQWWMTIQGKVE
jgi:hypothetical protein